VTGKSNEISESHISIKQLSSFDYIACVLIY